MKTANPRVEVDANHAIVWRPEGLHLLDQRVLPQQERFILCEDADDVAAAIQAMVVRGAPAIGITAAYGFVLAARQLYRERGTDWSEALPVALRRLAESRPTAVNLAWALGRMRARTAGLGAGDPEPDLLGEARLIHEEDIAANHCMAEFGAALIDGPTDVITHCNTGGLATGGHGTALGVIRTAFAQGRVRQVFADETRPWLQGARLTAWELARDGIPVALMADGAAAARMRAGGVAWVIVGADRIAANGDVANKIGTYGLAVAARHHGIGFMVAAPRSTIDLSVASGSEIPIEERAPEELLACAGQRVGAPGAKAWNPVFDVTPAGLVDAIVTERGVIRAPDAQRLAALVKD